MGVRLRSWWQQIKKHRVAIGVVAMVLVVAITLIIVGYWFDWAGFNGYNKVTIAHTISGTNAGTVIRTEEYQPGRTLWDWLQLLIIPVVLAVAGYIINLTISRGEQEATKQRAQSEREAAEKRAQTERDIASDNQREATLQEYFDKMSELLLEKDLRESQPADEVRTIARVRTLTVLSRLDKERKGSVLQFLHESGLIDKDTSIIDLDGANLREADLSVTHLSGAHLVGANLLDANLFGADLRGADLRANLFGANLREADLRGADLRGTYLWDADLSFAHLREADLSGAHLVGAKLSSAKLSGADLSGAHLVGANLSRADLRGANLSGVGLNISEVDLSEANLSGAIGISNEELEKGAKSLKGATMPDGSIHP